MAICLLLALMAPLQNRDDQATYRVELTVDGATCQKCTGDVTMGLDRLKDRVGEISATLREEKGTKTVVAAITLKERAPLDLRAIQNSLPGFTLRAARPTLLGYASASGNKIEFRARTSNQAFEIKPSPQKEAKKAFEAMLQKVQGGQVKFQVSGVAEAQGPTFILTLESASPSDFKDPKPGR